MRDDDDGFRRKVGRFLWGGPASPWVIALLLSLLAFGAFAAIATIWGVVQ